MNKPFLRTQSFFLDSCCVPPEHRCLPTCSSPRCSCPHLLSAFGFCVRKFPPRGLPAAQTQASTFSPSLQVRAQGHTQRSSTRQDEITRVIHPCVVLQIRPSHLSRPCEGEVYCRQAAAIVKPKNPCIPGNLTPDRDILGHPTLNLVTAGFYTESCALRRQEIFYTVDEISAPPCSCAVPSSQSIHVHASDPTTLSGH